MMYFDHELSRRFDRIRDAERAGNMLVHGGYARPLEAGVIGAAIQALNPEDWTQAVETAQRRMMESR